MVIVAAWASCETTTSRWWLIGTMSTLPWLFAPYWAIRAVRYRLAERRCQRRSAHIVERIASVQFWSRIQHSGLPVERAVAPRVLAFLAETAPPGLLLLN